MIKEGQPVLYVAQDEASEEALTMLKEAGFVVDVRTAPIHYRAAYGTPVLFGLFNRFEGIEGIRVFLENARIFRRQNGVGT